MTSPIARVINSFPCLPLMYLLDKTPVELTKTLLSWFELTSLAVAQERQCTLPTDPNKSMCPRSFLPLSVFTLP